MTHLSPGVSLIYDLAHDSGILQSELFTSRSQNLVLAKLPSSGFWKYGHFYPISLEKLAISPKTRIRQFGQNQILTPTGK